MKKKLILHIGLHKTGSTSLQFFLDRNSKKLQAEGIIYPKFGRETAPNVDPSNLVAHHKLALLLSTSNRKDLNIKSMQKAFNEEVGDNHTVILSSEAFQRVTDLSVLSDLFKDYEIHTTCYFREYLSYVASSYAQEIQTSNLFTSFEYYYKNHNSRIDGFISNWSGISKVFSPRLYQRNKLINKDISMDFLSAQGLDPSTLKLTPVVANPSVSNISISGNLLGFKLLINSMGLHQEKMPAVLGSLANKHPHFTGPIKINSSIASASKKCRYNELLTNLFGEIEYYNNENGNAVNSLDSIKEDYKLIMKAHRDFPSVYKHPLFNALS